MAVLSPKTRRGARDRGLIRKGVYPTGAFTFAADSKGKVAFRGLPVQRFILQILISVESHGPNGIFDSWQRMSQIPLKGKTPQSVRSLVDGNERWAAGRDVNTCGSGLIRPRFNRRTKLLVRSCELLASFTKDQGRRSAPWLKLNMARLAFSSFPGSVARFN